MIIFDANYTYANFLYNKIVLAPITAGPYTAYYSITKTATAPYISTYPIAIPFIASISTLYFNWGAGGTGAVMPGSRTGSYPAIIVNSSVNYTVSGSQLTNPSYNLNVITPDTPGALLPIAINNGGTWQLL